MKTLYTVNDGTTAGQEVGGLVPVTTTGGGQINWIVLPKKSPIAVSKQDNMKIITPEANQSADAWDLLYRRYHDLWIADNQLVGVRVNTGTLAV